MSANASSPSDFSHGVDCFIAQPSSFIYITFLITSTLLLLPLCILILLLGLQQWRQQRSTSTATTMNHSDSFTYHLVAMELIGIFGNILNLCGVCMGHANLIVVGLYHWSVTWYAEFFFHLLTCVERYLAVVHPITYRGLRGERGIRIRNISIRCVWLLCLGFVSLMPLAEVTFIMDSFLLGFSLVVISFCSVSVLCVLIRPRPGEQDGNRERVDQTKQKAFYTILVIFGVLVLKIVWCLICIVPLALKQSYECMLMASGIWFNLPCSLVLPLLFLHRTGNLACCMNK